MSAPRDPKFPLIRRLFGVVVRMVVLAGLVVLVGYGVGEGAGRLVAKIPDPIRGAKLLDHFALAASMNPAVGLLTAGDLPTNWTQGAPFFPAIGLPLCGKDTEAKGAKTTQQPVGTWTDAAGGGVIWSEIKEFNSVQFASTYMTKVKANFGKCDRYFVVADGKKLEFTVTSNDTNPPVDDYVSRIIQPKDKSSYEVYTLFQAGKTVIRVHYRGLVRPGRNVMSGAERKILERIDPQQFSTTTSSIKGMADLPEKTIVTIDQSKVSVINSGLSGPSGAVATLPPAVTNPPPSSIPPADGTSTTRQGRSSQGDG